MKQKGLDFEPANILRARRRQSPILFISFGMALAMFGCSEDRIQCIQNYSRLILASVIKDTTIFSWDTLQVRVKVVESSAALKGYVWSKDLQTFDTTNDPIYSVSWGIRDTGVNFLYIKVFDINGSNSPNDSIRVTVLPSHLALETIISDVSVFSGDTLVMKVKGITPANDLKGYIWTKDHQTFDTTSDSVYLVSWSIEDTGLNLVYVNAFDVHGQESPSDSIRVFVLPYRPVINKMADTVAHINKSLPLIASAQDRHGIAYSLWSYDGFLFDTISGSSFRAFWNSTKWGVNRLYVKVLDIGGGCSETDSFSVLVLYENNEVYSEDIPGLSIKSVASLKSISDSAQLRDAIVSLFHNCKDNLFARLPLELDSTEQFFVFCNIVAHKIAPYGTNHMDDLFPNLHATWLDCDSYATLAAEIFRNAIGPRYDSSICFWGVNLHTIPLDHCIPFFIKNGRSILIDPTFGIITVVSKEQLQAGYPVSANNIFSFYSYWNNPAQPSYFANTRSLYINALQNGLYQNANTSIDYYYFGFDWLYGIP